MQYALTRQLENLSNAILQDKQQSTLYAKVTVSQLMENKDYRKLALQQQKTRQQ